MSGQRADGQPVLQIIHVSDTHLVREDAPRWPDWNAPPWSKIERDALRGASGWRPALRRKLYEFIADGVAEHDPRALKRFLRFLADGSWRLTGFEETPVWLVHTGDLTTFGDSGSRRAMLDFLSRAAGHVDRVVAIWGNHDAWPGQLPYCAPQGIDTAYRQLLGDHAGSCLAPLPLRQPLPDGGGEIVLGALDTVYPDYIDNTLALGRVEDRCLERLRRAMGSSAVPRRQQFRILATHHPIHSDRAGPFAAGLMNAGGVGRTLAGGGQEPQLIDVVLSGHTHELFPPIHRLPDAPERAHHPHLGRDQMQLVIGSLCQYDRFGRRGDLPHQGQLLRLYHRSEGVAGRIALERCLFARTGTGAGTGRFELLEDAVELVRFPL